MDDTALQAGLEQLVEAELLYPRGRPPLARYLFKHALLQDAAYASLLRSTRQQIHQQIAELFERRFPELVETRPELVAHHYTEAGRHEQAIVYWQQAGQRALAHFAHVEAVSHLTMALALLDTLPVTLEHRLQELVLQAALGPALALTKGYAAPDVEQAYRRARELCGQMEDAPEFGPVLWGLWRYYFGRTQYETARQVGEQLLSLAQRRTDSTFALEGHFALGSTSLMQGELVPALEHLDRGIALHDPQQHRTLAFQFGEDLDVSCRSYAFLSRWIRGYPTAAVREMHATLTLAKDVGHPQSLCRALVIAAWLFIFNREYEVAREHIEIELALTTEQVLPLWIAMGAIVQGWLLARHGQCEEGLTQMRQSITTMLATGAEVSMPFQLLLLADVCTQAGQTEEGLRLIDEALRRIDSSGERIWEAMLYRLKGELLLKADCGLPIAELTPEACFHQAITIARSQQAKSWELRAATSLARLWQSQGKRQDAYDMLASVYGWFTEGFDTADLKEAQELLNELA